MKQEEKNSVRDGPGEAVSCLTLQRVAVCCTVLQHVALCSNGGGGVDVHS